jgi:uroporphyrinogen-III synthase
MGALVRHVIMELGRHDAIPTPGGLLQVRAGAATLDHRVLSLSPSGLAVLRRLARVPGEVVSREELLRVLPGESRDPHAAEVAVGRLRDAVGVPGVIRTVVKRGYALNPTALGSTE